MGDGRGVARGEPARPARGRSPGPSAGRGRPGCGSPAWGRERCRARDEPGEHGGAAQRAGAWPAVGSRRCAPEAGGEGRRAESGAGRGAVRCAGWLRCAGRRARVRCAECCSERCAERRGAPCAGYGERDMESGMRSDAPPGHSPGDSSARRDRAWTQWGTFLQGAPGRFRRAAAFLGAEPFLQSTGLHHQRLLWTQLVRTGEGV